MPIKNKQIMFSFWTEKVIYFRELKTWRPTPINRIGSIWHSCSKLETGFYNHTFLLFCFSLFQYLLHLTISSHYESSRSEIFVLFPKHISSALSQVEFFVFLCYLSFVLYFVIHQKNHSTLCGYFYELEVLVDSSQKSYLWVYSCTKSTKKL
jgi:hypothetical protein